MKVFFDTSSLFKLYHKESGTEEIIRFLTTNQIEVIYLAEISKLEFCSTVWKKCRKQEISSEVAFAVIEKFDKDSKRFSFVEDGHSLKMTAKSLLKTYWKEGLRTLDSIQLASILEVKQDVEIVFTSDKILSSISKSEGINVQD